MKIKEGFTLRKFADKNIVVASGEVASDFNKVIALDHSGKLLFEALLIGASEEELISLLLENYRVTLEKAKKDVKTFLQILTINKLLE